MLQGTAREAAAEFLGTFVLIAFGSAVVAQVVLSGQSHGGYLSINLAWGLAVTMGVYVAGGVSGAHLNPAVTLALALYRGFPWRKVAPYAAAQMAGAFSASAVTFLTYRAAFDRFDGGLRQVTGNRATAGIFATYPQEFLPTFPDGLIDQVVGTALLVALIFALGDRRDLAAPRSRSVSKRAHSRSSAGSVSALQTRCGGCGSSRTKTSVQRPPLTRVSASPAGPAW
jgi:MIP family channel proteins